MIKKTGHYLKILITNPFGVIRSFICKMRSIYFSSYIDEGSGQISVSDPWLRIKIKKSKGAKLIINGHFRITPHLGGTTPVRILLDCNSMLKIDGDFVIGHGVRLFVHENAFLYFGGKKFESDSGITADTLIMTYKKISVGFDFICAWNVFISDSDWHLINTKPHYGDVTIGDHGWIANNCSVLKGSNIGNNSIVASHSKVINQKYASGSMLAGTPAKIVESDVNWSRDIKTK